MDSGKIVENLVRIGTVTDVDRRRKRVRVKFQDAGITSAWLPVLAAPSPWLPEINATVLTLYLPVFNGDGFVLGVI